jgi:hypothetical protein
MPLLPLCFPGLACPRCERVGSLHSSKYSDDDTYSRSMPWLIPVDCLRCHIAFPFYICTKCKATRAFHGGRDLLYHSSRCPADADPAIQLPSDLPDASTHVEESIDDGSPLVDFSPSSDNEGSLSSSPCATHVQAQAIPIQWAKKPPADLLAGLSEVGARIPVNFLEYVMGGSDWSTPSSLELMHSNFFQQEYLHKGKGLSTLFRPLFVPICCTPKTLSLSWVLFSVLLAALLLEMGEDHRDKICMLMHLLLLKVAPGTNLPVLIPTTEHEIATYYMGNGKIRRSSLLESLPYPEPEELPGGFCYFPLPKLVQYAHASGHVLEPLHVLSQENIQSSTFVHSSTPRGLEILSQALKLHGGYRNIPDPLDASNIQEVKFFSDFGCPTVGVYSIVIWSDSFEAASTKQNRGSVWVCFVSIATPSPVFNSGRNTFLLGVGPSANSHDAVFRRLIEDLRIINQPGRPLSTLSRSLGVPVSVYVFPYVLLQDTPEKTSSNGLASFTAKNAAYYGYIMDIDGKEGLLPSCRDCFHRRMSARYMNNNTSDIDGCPSSSCYDWQPPGLEAISWSGLIGYFKSVLTRACTERMTDRASLIARLRTAGLSPPLAASLAEYIRERVHALGDNTPEPAEVSPPLPSLWHDPPFFDVGESIEVVMHQLFLGIVRSMAKDVIHPFLAGRGQWSGYSHVANEISSKIGSLKLSWMKILPMTDAGNHGGWVSENYLAYGRLLKYFGSIPCMAQGVLVPEYNDPDIPLEEFSLPQMKRWLRATGIEVCKPVNRTRVLKLDFLNTIRATGWQRVGDPPAPLRNPTRGTPIELFHANIQTCYSLLCLVMHPRDSVTLEQAWEVDRAAKLYLSVDDMFIDGVVVPTRPDRKIPALRKRNKRNLLKLSPSLIRYGPFHLLTELGPKGEGAIQTVKPIVKKGQGIHRDGWSKHVANGWARRHCLKTMIWMIIDAFRVALANDQTTGLPEDDVAFLSNGGNLFSQYFARTYPEDDSVLLLGATGSHQSKKSKYYHVYRSKCAVDRLLLEGRAPISVISALQREGGAHLYAMVYRDDSGQETLLVILPRVFRLEKAGCCFWEWHQVGEDESTTLLLEDVVIAEPLLLLPFVESGVGTDLRGDRCVEPKYYTISHGWREMDSGGELVVYRVSTTWGLG